MCVCVCFAYYIRDKELEIKPQFVILKANLVSITIISINCNNYWIISLCSCMSLVWRKLTKLPTFIVGHLDFMVAFMIMTIYDYEHIPNCIFIMKEMQ